MSPSTAGVADTSPAVANTHFSVNPPTESTLILCSDGCDRVFCRSPPAEVHWLPSPADATPADNRSPATPTSKTELRVNLTAIPNLLYRSRIDLYGTDGLSTAPGGLPSNAILLLWVLACQDRDADRACDRSASHHDGPASCPLAQFGRSLPSTGRTVGNSVNLADLWPLGNHRLKTCVEHAISGALGQAGLVEVPHVTRSPTVAGSELAAGIMQCAAWAVLWRALICLSWVTER